FGITLDAFRIAGGLLLFYIAFEMIFERRQQRHEKSAERAVTADQIRHIAVFPLAIPLIAGPGAITTVLLYTGGRDLAGTAVFVGVLLAVLLITLIALLLAPHIMRLFGETGSNVLTRVLGVLLAALAVQFIFDGLESILA
ncbi:MAG TPA: MarC family protein, partial [Rubrobacteraceae bacterium]|nr:MarC family protein [Rubrobacteraceae bacterium]